MQPLWGLIYTSSSIHPFNNVTDSDLHNFRAVPHEDTVKLISLRCSLVPLCVGSFCELESSPFMEKVNERSSHSSISGAALVIPVWHSPPSLLFYLSPASRCCWASVCGPLRAHISSVCHWMRESGCVQEQKCHLFFPWHCWRSCF